MYILKESIP